MVTFDIKGDKLSCGKTEAQDYADVLNGIVWDCWHSGGFERGWRNTIAVDLTVCADSLGLDPIKVLDALVDEEIIDPTKDDEDTWNRIRTVMDYQSSFSWDWMIDPDIFQEIAKDMYHRLHEMPVLFVIH